MTDKTHAAAQPINVTIMQPDRAAEGAQAIIEGQRLEMDKTVPGGRYKIGDTWVDADGKPLKGDSE